MSNHHLCNVSDIEEEDSKEFFIPKDEKEVSILAVKKDGMISVFLNNCPHLGVPMNLEPNRFLDVEKNFIMCSTHGALFKIDDGECVHGPCMGQNLTQIPHEIRGEELFIDKDL
ncbi:putative Rieske 2Fe-2S family protein [Candidatus Terasakiella magnetica]|uniref:Putative Rieske 2Fe-2S family protein n=1 Tax=Candidatus Terasakiella magnetica TaxID=1867952 RepID=A0A1C3RFW4_9PROT|nr:Rieske 2Fe-2S domain-containing protein [Candidatus Terasakiella magnetica]SCA56187.1 putative Rieske 2Fe-2S family protein [Candidatus Terasakiella magnetica]